MLEFFGFLIFAALFALAVVRFDGAGPIGLRNWFLTVLVVCVLGGILWEFLRRGFVFPFTW